MLPLLTLIILLEDYSQTSFFVLIHQEESPKCIAFTFSVLYTSLELHNGFVPVKQPTLLKLNLVGFGFNMNIMFLKTLPHLHAAPYSRMWRVKQTTKSTVDCQIHKWGSNIEIAKRWLEPKTSCITKL